MEISRQEEEEEEQIGPVAINLATRKIWVGCSGYAYKHWKGVFYPPELPTAGWLEYYCRFFPTVELNNTFYHLPAPTGFESWRNFTPPHFLFAVKASRFLTHLKKLKEPQEPLNRLFERVSLLSDKLGPVLYQLPPHWRFDYERLVAFLELLPPHYQHVLEIRDPSWLKERFFAALEHYQVAYCISSLPIYQTPVVTTASFAYFRFHGSRQMYSYNYSREELALWCQQILRFHAEGLPVYAYFDNDPQGWAVQNALALTRLLAQATANESQPA